MAKKKKKKFSIKKTLRLLIPLFLIIIILINSNRIITSFQSKITGYSESTINTFKDKNIYKTIKKSEYSKTLEEIINTNSFKIEYLDDYLQIKYCNNNNFLENINSLLTLGYNANDINSIYETLSDASIKLLLSNKYISNISDILSLNYFLEDNLERYIKYIDTGDEDATTSIIYVNIGLDYEYYTNTTDVENADNILVLVNKYNELSKDYVPSDLETVDTKYGTGILRKEARVAFEEMCAAALKDNIKIYAGSGYRSYATQLALYNRYVQRDGFTAAETYSARAGYSEHQTGLAMDIKNGNLEYISVDDEEYTWLVNNSYKYGFILRYPKDKENITGYMYEEWHFRYLGKDIAKELYDLNITYDEYVAKKSY